MKIDIPHHLISPLWNAAGMAAREIENDIAKFEQSGQIMNDNVKRALLESRDAYKAAAELMEEHL